MRSPWADVAPAIAVLNDASDDLVLLNPSHPPQRSVDVVSNDLNCSHFYRPKRHAARAAQTISFVEAEGSIT